MSSPLNVKNWRTALGWSRAEAAKKLGISPHTIKSYELRMRAVPAPMLQLMSSLEKDARAVSPSVAGAPIRIVGGGTVSHIRTHLAVCAPAYGTTARALMALCQAHDRSAELVLTRMADPASPYETTHDLEGWVRNTVADPSARIVFWNPAICDFDGQVGDVPSDRHAERLKTAQGTTSIALSPAPKLVSLFRSARKDLFVVAFKTTTGATPEAQYEAGLNLLKSASVNLVLANDTVTRLNMVIVPEEARYHETTDREVALAGLVEMALLRAQNTFTRSRVVSDVGVSWSDAAIPDNLREVVQHCIDRGAYKPFKGKTVGHFAVRGPDGSIITSRRKSNFNHLPEVGMVKIKPSENDLVLAYGGKPSVGGMSQKIIFDQHPDAWNIVHFHCPLKPGAAVAIRDQRPYECGSHQCGQNTSDGLALSATGIKAVMLDNHGPNIVYGKDVPASRVIEFIESHFDLNQKTGGLFTRPD